MEDRLKNLKKVMDQRTFSELTFTDQHKKKILERAKQNESESDIQLAVLQLLVQAKTGYELSSLLMARGIKSFQDQEGTLYTLLHRLEQSDYLRSSWDESGGKYYELNDKGRKLLKKSESKQPEKRLAFRALFEGGGK
ncbi:PadR family transcriptional regulator [Pseudoneobacillus sp. C159]